MDARDLNMGAWFEAQIVNVTKTTKSSSEDGGSDGEEEIIYHVKYEEWVKSHCTYHTDPDCESSAPVKKKIIFDLSCECEFAVWMEWHKYFVYNKTMVRNHLVLASWTQKRIYNVTALVWFSILNKWFLWGDSFNEMFKDELLVWNHAIYTISIERIPFRRQNGLYNWNMPKLIWIKLKSEKIVSLCIKWNGEIFKDTLY